MRKALPPSDLGRFATDLFQWISCDKPRPEYQDRILGYFLSQFPAQIELDEQWRTRLQALLDQPRIPMIAKHWRSRFAQGGLSAEDATHFVQQVLSAFESVDQFIDYHCTGGITSAEEGQWNDYPVFRPGHKRGWAMHLTVEGAGLYNCIRRTIQTSPGDLVLFSPTAYYDFRRSPDSAVWVHRWAAFYPDRQLTDLLEWPEIGAGICQINCGDRSELQKLNDAFDEIRQLSFREESSFKRLRTNLVEQILLRANTYMPVEKRRGVDRRIQAAIAFVDANSTTDFTIAQVADAANLSRASLARLFKQQTGMTVLEWRDEQRMSHACELLSQTNNSISEIALQLGYRDPLYFSRCFNHQFGKSPKAYRGQFLDG